MSEENPQVEDELEDHKSDLSMWVLAMDTLTIPENSKGIAARFKQDCQHLIDYIDEKDTPTSSDLVDFTDRRNSLEIQYLNITNRFK